MSRALSVVALCGTGAIVACGARSELLVPERESPVGDASSCTQTQVPVLPNVPNLYFVLDLSASMLDASKWTNVRSAVATLIDDLKTNARFGAAVFPPPNSTANPCAAGAQVMPLTLGDDNGNTARSFLAATALTPAGGTPTAATFRALTPQLSSVDGVTYVILATDGGPNCNAALAACAVDQCTSNIDGVTDAQGNVQCPPNGPPNCCSASGQGCLDGSGTAEAIGGLRSAGVQTYVMGIPGSAAYATVLDDMAIAGGTARPSEPRYYQVNSPEIGALSDTLTTIALEAMKSCTFLLQGTPSNPAKVNVYVDGTLVRADGPDGWMQDGRKVTLQGAACNAIQADAGPPPVTVFVGCPTEH